MENVHPMRVPLKTIWILLSWVLEHDDDVVFAEEEEKEVTKRSFLSPTDWHVGNLVCPLQKLIGSCYEYGQL